LIDNPFYPEDAQLETISLNFSMSIGLSSRQHIQVSAFAWTIPHRFIESSGSSISTVCLLMMLSMRVRAWRRAAISQ
jgi:hypothetical protein